MNMATDSTEFEKQLNISYPVTHSGEMVSMMFDLELYRIMR